MKKVISLLLALASISSAYAQTLNPSQGFPFLILSIWVFPVRTSPYGGNLDYPETLLTQEHPLGLEGHTKDYLNIRWNASYSDWSTGYIRVECRLNTGQTCAKTSVSGEEDGCTIMFPSYNYDSLNTVVCNFTDPLHPNLFNDTVNRSIQPIAFSVGASLGSVTVGQELAWEIDVLNKGALATNFSVNISSSSPTAIWINPSVANTSSVYWGEVAKFHPQLSFLLATDLTLKVLVRPTVDDRISCPCPQIPYTANSECIDNKCWYKLEIPIKVKIASLPEFDVFGILQIILLAMFLLLILIKSKY
jgi:hypothetical protein